MKYQLIKLTSGWIGVAWSDIGLSALTLPLAQPAQAMVTLIDYLQLNPEDLSESDNVNSLINELTVQLNRYFAGDKCHFNFPVDLTWATPFQRQVLQAIQKIPYGQTRSYKQVAEMIGRPNASRAVGNTLARNRVLLVLPCHRVIKQDGSLGGFGASPAWKEKLLKIEGVTIKR